MSAELSVAALRVANEAFLVSSTIERCPKTMMIRELVVNSIEAASRSEGQKLVNLTSRLISNTPKLCIRNTGPGLSAVELDKICDLASTLHKESGLDANFGMGAKVASLPSNKHGMRYRSCKHGTVSEVILGQRNGVYGRLRRMGPDGKPVEVVDVTEACREEGGYDLSMDWTEVVLFGNTAGQNTVLDPYAANPPSDTNWLPQKLLMRFFRVPQDVTIELPAEIGAPAVPKRRFTPLGERLGTIGQFETIRTASGIAIHYLYVPPGAASALPGHQDLTSLGGLGCIVYKDEIYDMRTGPLWTLDAPNYGIPFGANLCAVFVELPVDYLVRPEAYRQFLRFRGGDQRQVFLRDFGPLVRASLPTWLAKIIRSLGPSQSRFVEEVENELRDLLADLGIEARFSPCRVRVTRCPPSSQSPPTRPCRRPLRTAPSLRRPRQSGTNGPPKSSALAPTN